MAAVEMTKDTTTIWVVSKKGLLEALAPCFKEQGLLLPEQDASISIENNKLIIKEKK